MYIFINPCYLLFFLIFIYLKIRVTETGRKDTERSSTCWFKSSHTCNSQGWIKAEPRTRSFAWVSMWMAGTQVLVLKYLLPPGYIRRKQDQKQHSQCLNEALTHGVHMSKAEAWPSVATIPASLSVALIIARVMDFRYLMMVLMHFPNTYHAEHICTSYCQFIFILFGKMPVQMIYLYPTRVIFLFFSFVPPLFFLPIRLIFRSLKDKLTSFPYCSLTAQSTSLVITEYVGLFSPTTINSAQYQLGLLSFSSQRFIN